jgi:hypothetical protein
LRLFSLHAPLFKTAKPIHPLLSTQDAARTPNENVRRTGFIEEFLSFNHFFLIWISKEQFLLPEANPNNHKMQLDITNSDLQTLLALYNHEIDKLKVKLLNGESWENLKPVRSNITELAIAIQKAHGYNVALAGTLTGVPEEANKVSKLNSELMEEES